MTKFSKLVNTMYNENDLFVAPCRNAKFAQNPVNIMVQILNHLPENIKAIKNIKMFYDMRHA